MKNPFATSRKRKAIPIPMNAGLSKLTTFFSRLQNRSALQFPPGKEGSHVPSQSIDLLSGIIIIVPSIPPKAANEKMVK